MPKRTDIHKIMLLGAGPIVIGQGCEFDYSGVQACKVLKQQGYELVLLNSNPATVMTDPEFADRTYLEPMTPEYLHEIIRRERPDALLPTLGGQTALNLAMEAWRSGVLKRYHVELIGADAEAISRAEDRNEFKATMESMLLHTKDTTLFFSRATNIAKATSCQQTRAETTQPFHSVFFRIGRCCNVCFGHISDGNTTVASPSEIQASAGHNSEIETGAGNHIYRLYTLCSTVSKFIPFNTSQLGNGAHMFQQKIFI